MGGIGSGRWYRPTRRASVEHRPSLDIRAWQREGLLAPDCFLRGSFTQRNGIWVKVETGFVCFSYRHRTNGGERETVDYPVRLDTTPCHYGGERHWFRCPAAGCGRRVAKLYLGRRIFVCRQCLRLAYPCQREARYDRMARRANKLRERLGWEPGIFDGPGEKPKGMHWRTFERLSAEALQRGQASVAEAERHFRMLR